MEFNSATLRNKGVPVDLYKVVQVQDIPEKWDVIRDDAGDPSTESVWLRFTANEIAEVEDKFNGVSFVETEHLTTPKLDEHGNEMRDENDELRLVYTGESKQFMRSFNGIEGFQKASTHKPLQTMRDVMAICLGRSVKEIGTAMIPSETATYGSAVAAAFGLATGSPVEQVGKGLELQRIQLRRRLEAQQKVQAEALDKQEQEEKDLVEKEAAEAKENQKAKTTVAPASSGNGKNGLDSGSEESTLAVSGEALLSSGV